MLYAEERYNQRILYPELAVIKPTTLNSLALAVYLRQVGFFIQVETAARHIETTLLMDLVVLFRR